MPHRPTVTKTAPSISKHVHVQNIPSKPLLAYQMVTLPSVEILHQNFNNYRPTQAIVEDPHLDKKRLVQNVLANFANREMIHGMIKVELSLMLWSYKNLNLPDYVVKLLIENLTDSLSKSARPTSVENQLERSADLSRHVRESNFQFQLGERSTI